MRTPLATLLYELQHRADQLAWLFRTDQVRIEFRLVYTAGDSLPWRLFETHRAPNGSIQLRRMHCFRGEASLRRFLEEYAAWKRRDRALVKGLRFDNVSRDLDTQRRELRRRMAVTPPDRTIELPRRAPAFT